MATECKTARRIRRNRFRLAEKASGRLRLSVFRSNKYIYAQVIDDQQQKTLVSASTLEKDVRGSLAKKSDCEAARLIGKAVAERAIAKGISQVVFDRGGYLYHGRVKALADAAREAGLSF